MLLFLLCLPVKLDEGMPMVYWVSTESPATMISICLPPMLNIIRRFHSGILTPISSKISSMMSTTNSKMSTFKTLGSSTSNTGHPRSEANSEVNLRIVYEGGKPEAWEMNHRPSSTGSRNDVGH